MANFENTSAVQRTQDGSPTLRLAGWRWGVRDGLAEAIERHTKLPIGQVRALLKVLLDGGEAHLDFPSEAELAAFLAAAEALDARPLSSAAVAVGREQIRARLMKAFAALAPATPAERTERAVILLAEHVDRLVGISLLSDWNHSDALSSDAALAVDGAMALVRVELYAWGAPPGVQARWAALESEWEEFAAADTATSAAVLRLRVDELRRLLSRGDV